MVKFLEKLGKGWRKEESGPSGGHSFKNKDDVDGSGDDEHEPSMEELMMMKLAPVWSGFVGWFSVELVGLVWQGCPAS